MKSAWGRSIYRCAVAGVCTGLAAVLSLSGAGQSSSFAAAQTANPPTHQPGQPAAATGTPRPQTIEEARANLSAAEAAHPGNTPEVAKALISLLTLGTVALPADEDLLRTAQRAVAVAEAAAGKESGLYAQALTQEAWVYVNMDRPELARPVAEDALATAQRSSDEEAVADAAEGLANVCSRMGDYECYLRNAELAAKTIRTVRNAAAIDVVSDVLTLVESRRRNQDMPGARAALDEVLAMISDADKSHIETGVLWAVVENDIATFYTYVKEYDNAIPHYKKAIDLDIQDYGPDGIALSTPLVNLAYSEAAVTRIDDALKDYDWANRIYLKRYGPDHALTASLEEGYASVLNFKGRYQEAADLALTAHRVERQRISLAIRLLPERQALALADEGAVSTNVALTLAALHPEIRVTDIYQEVVRSRALVTEEMAQRAAALSRKPDPAVQAVEDQLDIERRTVLELQGSGSAQALGDATARMERAERELAARSAAFRTGERARSSDLADLASNLPKQSVLVSYVRYTQYQMEKDRFRSKWVPSYIAFVLHPGGEKVSVYNLGDAKPIDDLVGRMRASADAEAHSGGLGEARNERAYRQAGEQLRKLVWDPLAAELTGAKMALIVPDGVLNLIPFAALPSGNGYLVERGPVVHVLTSERDLIPVDAAQKKTGLLALGSPAFELAQGPTAGSVMRGASVTCAAFSQMQFDSLPASLAEVREISSTWKRWNPGEPAELLTGAKATRASFLEAASRSRVLHVATHAFVLDKSCGNGNPLLHSGLVFAGASRDRDASILTAQQIASLDLIGVDWAVLSACNTGSGELKDGEGVLGLERSFRVAGARSVVMTLWPVDDETTREFMRQLYAERFAQRATTAQAAWWSARALLAQRRTAGKSTHPWYWAGFVSAGEWE